MSGQNKIVTFFARYQGIVATRYAFAIFIIFAAAGLRIWPLGALELRIPWVTFYPAVMAAALYGGFSSGILGTALTAFLVLVWSPTDQPFIDDSGDFLGLAVFSVNGTLISLMSGAMHKARADAQAANQAKSVFLANMSHELRTPLNAILGFTNLLKKEHNTTSEQVDKLGIISNSADNLLNLINNVLDISKIEAGHMAKEETSVNLHRLLYEIQSLMSVKVKEKGLSMEIDLSPDLPQYVWIDPGKLRQILTNLVANAVKFTEVGSISLKVSTTDNYSKDQIRLRFEVTDTGMGISAEDQDKIFDAFLQIGDQPATESGTGLGLAICRQFVELMGGRIGVKSQLGKGSTFYFELHVNITQTSKAKLHSQGNKTAIGIQPGQPRYRILIAEDKFENRLLLQAILEPFEFEIREAVNGKEAVEQFKQWHPHLIWMDIRMPVMTGLDATRIIKEMPSRNETKIIALTAHALEEERNRIIDAGCDDFIRKPYLESEIIDTLANNLGIKFLYSSPDSTSKGAVGNKPDKKQLDQIPVELIHNLIRAAELLDEQLCRQIIDEISRHQEETAQYLGHLVEQFNYRKLLELLDNTDQKEPL